MQTFDIQLEIWEILEITVLNKFMVPLSDGGRQSCIMEDVANQALES